jgi:hypothetical protein
MKTALAAAAFRCALGRSPVVRGMQAPTLQEGRARAISI